MTRKNYKTISNSQLSYKYEACNVAAKQLLKYFFFLIYRKIATTLNIELLKIFDF